MEGEGLLASAQTFLLCGFGFFVFPDLPFQFRQLHWCIKLPINSHKNQEIITLQQSIHLQLCAEVRQHAGRISNYIRRGCPNHAHISGCPSRILGCHPMLRPAEKWCHPTRQGEKDKSGCPLSSSKLGYMRHPCLSFLMPVLSSWQELEGFYHLAKHKARRTEASMRKEDTWVRSIPACPTICSEPSAMTCTKFPSDNSASEMLLTLETLAPGLAVH